MTQKYKEILLKDLCARLPYEVKGKLRDSNYTAILKDVRYSCFYPLLVRPLECPLTNDDCSLDVDEFKPYLRPMSRMTDEEKSEYFEMHVVGTDAWWIVNWLNERYLDYHYLIDKGLALEAPEGMYKTE